MEYKRTLMRFHALILSVLFCALTAGAAETIPFTVSLSGDQVVPPIATTLGGTGLVTLTEHTMVVLLYLRKPPAHDGFPRNSSWHVTVNGPASAETNGPVLFDLGNCGQAPATFTIASSGTGVIIKPRNVPPKPPARPVGSCETEDVRVLSASERTALLAGLLYVEAEGFGVRIRSQIRPTDSDTDGVPDYLDWCPNTLPDTLVNRDGCSLDQLVPCEGPWKNQGQFEKAFKDATKSFVEDGLITKQTKHELDKEAAHSDCGKKR